MGFGRNFLGMSKPASPEVRQLFRALAKIAGGERRLAATIGLSVDPIKGLIEGRGVHAATWFYLRSKLPRVVHAIGEREVLRAQAEGRGDEAADALDAIIADILARLERLEEELGITGDRGVPLRGVPAVGSMTSRSARRAVGYGAPENGVRVLRSMTPAEARRLATR